MIIKLNKKEGNFVLIYIVKLQFKNIEIFKI